MFSDYIEYKKTHRYNSLKQVKTSLSEIDGTLTGTTASDQSGPGNNTYERITQRSLESNTHTHKHAHTHTHIYIYIYIVIQGQTVSLYHNSSV